MAVNIIQFFFLYTLLLLAFACGLNQLLGYYADAEKQLCNSTITMENRDTCVAWRRFSTVFESSQSLFWASFGLIDLDNFDLTGIKSYTRFWGLLMFGSYCVINIIVLINLLIAMLSNSYHTISTRSDIEWKFARTKLFMEYFEKADTLPPPFNIFPKIIFLKVFELRRPNGSGTLETMSFKSRDEKYKAVMKNLVWRYVTSQQRNAENHTVTEDDISEIRKDISSFRYELMNVLSGSGMNTSAVHTKRSETAKRKSKTRSRQLMNDFNIALAETVDSNWKRQNPSAGSEGHRMERNWQSLIQNVCNSRVRVESLSRLQSDSWKYLLEDMEMISKSGMNLKDETCDKSKDISKCSSEDKNDIDGLIECIDSLCQCDSEFSLQVPNSTKTNIKDEQEAVETETMKNFKFKSVKIQREITSNSENKRSDIYSISASLKNSEREDNDRSLPMQPARSDVKIEITSNIIRSESTMDEIYSEPVVTWI